VVVHPSRIARLRAVEVSPVTFRRVAVGALLAIFVVVTTGAVVRLTASGLGCDNWPRCGDTPFPEKGGHAIIEFGNRVVALGAILFTALSWAAARRVRGLPPTITKLALAAFLGNVAQIPLGGLTVIFELHPLLVMAHFLLAMCVLAACVVVAIESHRLVVGGAGLVVPRRLRHAGLALGLSCLVLVVTGMFATAAGPHPGDEDIRRLGDPHRSVIVHAVATAVFGAAFAFVLVHLVRHKARWPGLIDAAFVVAVILGAQIAVGEVQYHNDLPWWLVLVHVGLAAGVWGSTVALVTVLWRPPASLVNQRT
jgi:cytochrome c oxidase assembly protein subunit 15